MSIRIYWRDQTCPRICQEVKRTILIDCRETAWTGLGKITTNMKKCLDSEGNAIFVKEESSAWEQKCEIQVNVNQRNAISVRRSVRCGRIQAVWRSIYHLREKARISNGTAWIHKHEIIGGDEQNGACRKRIERSWMLHINDRTTYYTTCRF